MRDKLRKIGSKERHRFTGTFIRTGWKSGYMSDGVETVLLQNIKDESGKIVTDHLWFNMTRGFYCANLSAGDIVQFDARVEPYIKGYMGYRDNVYCPIEDDYKLSRPTKVVNLSHPERKRENPPARSASSMERQEKPDWRTEPPTEAQLGYVTKLCAWQKTPMPSLSSKKEASDWIKKQDTDAFAEWARTEKQKKLKEKRYHDICALADDGKSTKEIGEDVGLSVATVRKYLRHRKSEQDGEEDEKLRGQTSSRRCGK